VDITDNSNGITQKHFKTIELQDIMIPINFVKCAGQAKDGSMVCAYRTGCHRFTSESVRFQDWADFWQAGDDCPKYFSVPTQEYTHQV
jgi:hypothetical protein